MAALFIFAWACGHTGLSLAAEKPEPAAADELPTRAELEASSENTGSCMRGVLSRLFRGSIQQAKQTQASFEGFLKWMDAQKEGTGKWMGEQKESFHRELRGQTWYRNFEKTLRANSNPPPAKVQIPAKVWGLPKPTQVPEHRVRATHFVQALNRTPVSRFFPEYEARGMETLAQDRALKKRGKFAQDSAQKSLLMADPKLDYYEAEMNRFVKYFNASVRWKRVIGRVPDPPGFVEWFNKHVREILTRQQVSYMMKEGYNFERFRNETLKLYEETHGAAPLGKVETAMSVVTRNPTVQKSILTTHRGAVKIVTFVGGVLYFATVTGPVGGIVNNYVAPVFGPLQNTAGKVGAEHLKDPSRLLQSSLDKLNATPPGELKKGRDALMNLQKELRNAKVLGPEKWESVLKEKYSKLYYDTLIAMQTDFPSNIRDGRGAWWDVTGRYPLSYATAASTFQGEANSLTVRYENLKFNLDKVKAREKELRSDPLTHIAGTNEARELMEIQEQLSFMRDYPGLLRNKRKQVATAMVLWRLHDFQYQAVTQPRDSEGNRIETDYDRMKKWMGFDDYSELFLEEINELVDRIDNYALKVQSKKKEE